MIKTELDDDINPYIHDDETHYKLNHSHYVLGQNDLRALQNNAKKRREETRKMIDELGVSSMIKKRNRDEIIKDVQVKISYLENKTAIDEIFKDVLKVCTIEEVIEYLQKYINEKS